jgi:hypothetical protein
MSDIRDEIDWEFPGANITQGQSNYFWQGVIRSFLLHSYIAPDSDPLLPYTAAQTNGETTSGLTDTSSNYHDYTVRLCSSRSPTPLE